MEKSKERQISNGEVKYNREEQIRNILPDIFNAWDPMGYTFHSPLNRYQLDPEDVTQGQNCIFYDDFSESCLMGDNCRALHVKEKEAKIKRSGPVTSEKKFQNPQERKHKRQERVSCANYLDRRAVAAPASLFKAVVTCAETPSNFFLVPQFHLNCACSGICSLDVHRQKHNPQQNPSKPEISSKKKYSGIEGYNAFLQETSKDMENKCKANHSSHGYEESELVAFDAGSVSISVKKSHRPLWLRGVLASPVYEEEYNQTFPTAEVFFFDNGHVVNTTTRHIRQLPLLYSKIPPFAIRCELYGIRPKRSPKNHQGKSEPHWSADAIKDFRKLVRSSGDPLDTRELQTKNLVIVEVKKSTCTDSEGVFQPTPYSIMITVAAEDKNGKAINVSEEMVKMSHAEFTNFNPECGYSFSEWEFLNPLSSL